MPVLAIGLFLGLASRVWGAEEKPVWLLSNTFHTSIVLRARDLPFANEISGSPHADELAIGWGSRADYVGPSTIWTVLQAIPPNPAAIHVVPIHGPITRRFRDSDVVELWLKPAGFAELVSEIDRSFAFTRDHRRIFIAPGYYPDSRFYQSSELFYFPYVCNSWVAIKLNRAGTHFFTPCTFLAPWLIGEGARQGMMLQRHHGPQDGY